MRGLARGRARRLGDGSERRKVKFQEASGGATRVGRMPMRKVRMEP